MRLLLSVVIVVLIIVYVLSPLFKYIVRLISKEKERLSNNFNIDKKLNNKEKENE